MMCQAYEAERNWIVYCEQMATVEGYEAAQAGKPRAGNPHRHGSYDHKAWLHGFDCVAAGIVPYAVEKKMAKA